MVTKSRSPWLLTGCHIDGQIREPKCVRRSARVTSTEKRTKSCQEFLEGERLDQVVVRTSVESCDPIADGVPGGEHENGDRITLGAQVPADLKAVDNRHENVQHYRIGLIVTDGDQGFSAILGGSDVIALERKSTLERPPDGGLVIDNQYALPFQRVRP